MTSTAEEKAFLRVAVAAVPRVAEIVSGFPPDDRAGALEAAERSFLAAALDYGCTDITARSRVSAIMRRLRSRLERLQASEKKLQALLQRLTEQLNPRSAGGRCSTHTVRPTRVTAPDDRPSLLLCLC